MTKSNTASLSCILKQLMAARDISATELSQKTGVSQPSITRIVNGDTLNPGIESLRSIAAFFSITIDQLIGDSDSESYSTGEINFNKPSDVVPLLSPDEVLSWPANKHDVATKKLIRTNRVLPGLSFAYTNTEDFDVRFPIGCIFVFNTKSQPSNNDYVLADCNDNKMPILKKFRAEGELACLCPINVSVSTDSYIQNFRIIGVLVQVIYDL